MQKINKHSNDEHGERLRTLEGLGVFGFWLLVGLNGPHRTDRWKQNM